MILPAQLAADDAWLQSGSVALKRGRWAARLKHPRQTACGRSSDWKRGRTVIWSEDFITNNAFGGADMKTLYVTAGKTLYKIRMEVAGLPRWL